MGGWAMALALRTLAPEAPVPGWNRERAFRRAIAVRNRLDRTLENGFTLEPGINPGELREKSQPGYQDWAIVKDGRHPPSGQSPGPVREVAFAVTQGAHRPPGAIRIRRLRLRPYLDLESRPAATLGAEEPAP